MALIIAFTQLLFSIFLSTFFYTKVNLYDKGVQVDIYTKYITIAYEDLFCISLSYKMFPKMLNVKTKGMLTQRTTSIFISHRISE